MAGVISGVLAKIGEYIQDPESNMPGNPVKFAERIVEIVDGTGLGKGLEKCLRFLFGRDAVKKSSIMTQELAKDFEASQGIAHSTDFEGNTSDGVAVVAEMIQNS